MTTYRVEVEETTVISREKFIEADSEDEARTLALEMDWRTWDGLETTTSAEIVRVENCDEQGG